MSTELGILSKEQQLLHQLQDLDRRRATIDADGGCTVDDNLGPLCWRDHRLKHLCQWSLQQPEPGRYVWISPVGQRHEVAPETLLDP